MGWRDVTTAALVTWFTEECEFPPGHAEKLAATLIDLSEPEFGEADCD